MTALTDAIAKWSHVEAKVAKLGGLGKTKLEPPRCSDENPSPNYTGGRVDAKPCSHALGFHEATGADVGNGSAGYFGLSRGKDGAFRFVKPRATAHNGQIPTRTHQSVVACAAVGLAYWADHPKPNHVWAVDAQQRSHVVELDRKRGTARHSCYVWTRDVPGQCDHPTQGERADWTLAPTMAAFADVLAAPLTPGEGSTLNDDALVLAADHHVKGELVKEGPLPPSPEQKFKPLVHVHDVMDEVRFDIAGTGDLDLATGKAKRRSPGSQSAATPKKRRSPSASTTPAPVVQTDAQVAAFVIASIEFDEGYLAEATDLELITAYYRCPEESGEIENAIGAELDRRGVDHSE